MNNISVWQIVAVVISPILGVLAAMLRRKQKPPLSLLYVGIPSSVLGAALALGAAAYGVRAFGWLYRSFGLYAAQGLVAIAVVGIGAMAHFFKKKNQLWYGISEVFFAAASGLQIAMSMKPGETVLSQWASLVGAAYVVARGLNNISEWREKSGNAATPLQSMATAGSNVQGPNESRE